MLNYQLYRFENNLFSWLQDAWGNNKAPKL